jgi:5-methylcytosine-specific restriction endonuclease McrA
MEKKLSNKFQINNKTIGKINNKDLIDFDIVIPNEQRIMDSSKVDEIVEYQQEYNKKYNAFNFTGVINIHILDNIFYLVDGQHRYNAIKKLTYMGYELIDVCIEIVVVNSMDELKQNYDIINKNTPLPEFPDTIDKNIPEKVALHFFEKYPGIWSQSNTKRVRRPHLNKNDFQEVLGILTEKLGIDNSIKLQTLLEDYNTKLSQWPMTNYPNYKSYKDPQKIQQKCQQTNMYLGLFIHKSNDYGYDWVKSIIKEHTGEDITPTKHKSKNNGNKIPQSLRKQTWFQNIGEKIGSTNCICCNINIISQLNFEAGHIQPKSKGGTNTIDNLLPICGDCNRSMSSQPMEEYITKYHPDSLSRFHNRSYNKNSLLNKLSLW